MTKKTYNTILSKINNKNALVLTAYEFKKKVESNSEINIKDVDIITTGTRGLMSGTYVVLSISLRKFPKFKKAKKVYLNDIECYVGPCPNENLNIIDIMVFGTSISVKNKKYGGGHLFKDLVLNKKIKLELYTYNNKVISGYISIQEIDFAKMISTRNSFKNYNAFVNDSNQIIKTIFHPDKFNPYLKEATVSGCGYINPLEFDYNLKTIGIGTKVLVNGGEGYIIGFGTRSSNEKQNLMIVSDLKRMIPEYMGGFNTSVGPECIVSISIPILNVDNILESYKYNSNSNILLNILSVNSRETIASTYYSDVWDGRDEKVKFEPSYCLHCDSCIPIMLCPCKAISKSNDGDIILKRSLCFNCGYCTTICNSSVFSADMGHLSFKYDENEYKVPIVCRQSDLFRAKKISSLLKNKILNNKFIPSNYSNKLF